MRILILSCGTRSKLIEYFKKDRNYFDVVVGTDCSELAPALYACDKYYIVPRITDKKYMSEILKICESDKIDVVVPLFEDELVFMAQNKSEFAKRGILLVVSDEDTVNICRNKKNLYNCLINENIPIIPYYDSLDDYIGRYNAGKATFPVFVKPVSGAGSVGAMKVDNLKLLTALIENNKEELLIQPYIEGTEFGSDTYVDFISGEVSAVFTKRKLRMRAGETEKSVSFKDEKLFELITRTALAIGAKGPIDMDVFFYDGEYRILEVNPRFGGGYPHAYECGVDFVKMIYNNAKGIQNKNTVGDYSEDVYMLKYTDLVIV